MSTLLRVSLRQLEYFVAVVELQTMGAAAARWQGSIAQLQAWLHDGTCELAVMYDIGLEPNLECTELYRVRPHAELPADHPLVARPRIRMAQLAREPMIMLDMPPSREYFISLFA